MTTSAISGLSPVTLEGAHVRLEPLSLDHVGPLVAAARGPRETYRFTSVPASGAEMAPYVATALELQAARRALPFATVDRATGRVVGSTRFGNIEFRPWPPESPLERGEDVPDVVEIGWTWLAAGAQRTAINTEAKLLMLAHAFDRWRVHRVSLMTDSRNARSRAAIRRLGARFAGVVRAQRPAADGTVRDTACYSILDREWPDVRSNLESRLAQQSRTMARAPR